MMVENPGSNTGRKGKPILVSFWQSLRAISPARAAWFWLSAGRQDFIYLPEAQEGLAAGIPNSRLVFIDRAGHSLHEEHPAEVVGVIWNFLATAHDG